MRGQQCVAPPGPSVRCIAEELNRRAIPYPSGWRGGSVVRLLQRLAA
jgi:hypothetical protein